MKAFNKLRLSFLNHLDYLFNKSSFCHYNFQDDIYAVNGSKLEFVERILSIYKNKPQYLYEVRTNTGSVLYCTKNTLFVSKNSLNDKWKRVIPSVGNYVLMSTKEGYRVDQIVSIKKTKLKYITFKITTNFVHPTCVVNEFNISSDGFLGKIILLQGDKIQFKVNIADLYYNIKNKLSCLEEYCWLTDLDIEN